MQEDQADCLQVDPDVQPSGDHVSLDDKEKLCEQQGADFEDYWNKQQWQQLEDLKTLPSLSLASMKQRMKQVINYVRSMDIKQWPDHTREFLSKLMEIIQAQMSNLKQAAGNKLSQADEQRMNLYKKLLDLLVKKDPETVDDFLKTTQEKAA